MLCGEHILYKNNVISRLRMVHFFFSDALSLHALFPDALIKADMMIIVADIISLGSVLVELVTEVVAIV